MLPVLIAKDGRVWGGDHVLLPILCFYLKVSRHTEAKCCKITKSVFARLVPTDLSNKGARKRHNYFFYQSVPLVALLKYCTHGGELLSVGSNRLLNVYKNIYLHISSLWKKLCHFTEDVFFFFFCSTAAYKNYEWS